MLFIQQHSHITNRPASPQIEHKKRLLHECLAKAHMLLESDNSIDRSKGRDLKNAVFAHAKNLCVH